MEPSSIVNRLPIDSSRLQDAMQHAVDRLVARLAPVRVYLFGSQARGDAAPASDYDLPIVVSNSHSVAHLPGFKRDRLAYRALVGVGISKDVLVWTEEEFEARRHWPASLPATVLREGRVLYEQRPYAA